MIIKKYMYVDAAGVSQRPKFFVVNGLRLESQGKNPKKLKILFSDRKHPLSEMIFNLRIGFLVNF